MKLFEMIKNFHNDESGAVTVDWVVLTAAVVGLAVAAYTTIETETKDLASAAGSRIAVEDTLAAD